MEDMEQEQNQNQNIGKQSFHKNETHYTARKNEPCSTSRRILRLCTARGIPPKAIGLSADILSQRIHEIVVEEAEPTKEEVRKLADAFSVEASVVTGAEPASIKQG